MESGISTLNEDQGVPAASQSGGDPGQQVAPSTTLQTYGDDLISTVDTVPPEIQGATPPEGALKTGESAEEGKKQEGQEAKPGEGTPEEDRFDKHPRFQELLNRVKKAEQRAAKAESLVAETKTKETPTESSGELPFKDVSKMSKDEILEWQDNDPHAYHENLLKQAEYNLSKRFEEKIGARSFEDAVSKTYENFAKDNPKFDEMWDSGDLKAYMDKNPGHNAISAFYALTAEEAQKAMDKKMAEVAKEAEKKALETYRIKRESSVLPSGPTWSGAPHGVSPELQDSKKFGGSTAVLAARAAARMAQKGR